MRARWLIPLLAAAVGAGWLWWTLSQPPPGADGSAAVAPSRRPSRPPGPPVTAPSRPARPAQPATPPDIARSGDDASDPDEPDEPDDDARTAEEPPVMNAMAERSLAYQAFRAGAFEAVLGHTRKVIDVLPRDVQAHRLAALSACELGRGEVAQRHADMLDRRRFEQVQGICQTRGIALRHPYDDPAADGELSDSPDDDPDDSQDRGEDDESDTDESSMEADDTDGE